MKKFTKFSQYASDELKRGWRAVELAFGLLLVLYAVWEAVT